MSDILVTGMIGEGGRQAVVQLPATGTAVRASAVSG
jgi:hypothetical protein